MYSRFKKKYILEKSATKMSSQVPKTSWSTNIGSTSGTNDDGKKIIISNITIIY